MRFKIDWASLIVGSKFTVFALFYFVFEGNFPSTSPRGAYIWRGDLTEGFLRYRLGGLIFGGAYTWRGLFSEFYGMWCRFFYLPKVSRDFDVQIVISWSLWSGFLRATLFGNSEFFIFVPAFFFFC